MASNVSGLEKLKARLAKMSAEMKAPVKAALEKNAQQLMEMQKRFVPEDSGELRDSIRSEPGKHEFAIVVRAGGETTTKPIRKAKNGSKVEYDYALAQEFGTERMPANPFFWPAYRTLRKPMRARVNRAIRKVIKDNFPSSGDK